MKKMTLRRAIAATLVSASLLTTTGIAVIDNLFGENRTGGSLCC